MRRMAKARRQDAMDAAQTKAAKGEKLKKLKKYGNIAGTASHLVVNIASCVVNPFAAFSVISSFVDLANLMFRSSGSVSAGPGGLSGEASMGTNGESENELDFGDDSGA